MGVQGRAGPQHRVGPQGGPRQVGIGILWQVEGAGRSWMVFQKKCQCKNQFLSTAWGDLPNPIESTMDGGDLPHRLVVMITTRCKGKGW